LRAFSRRPFADQGGDVTASEIKDATRDFRKRKRFRSAAELEAWLRARHLSREDFLRLMEDEARRLRLDAMHAAAIDDALVDELALADAQARLQARADEKHAVLEARGVEQPTLVDAGLSEVEMIAWFLAECGLEPVDADPGEIARQLGFIDKDDLLRAALREYCYRAWKDS
jgi:AraC-like DNA-binding protein